MGEDLTVVEWATIISSFGALALAIATFLTLREIRNEKKPKINVEISEGTESRVTEVNQQGISKRESKPTIIVTALNKGQREVTLQFVELWLENIQKLNLKNILPDFYLSEGKRVFITLPYPLLPGRKFSAQIYSEDILRALKREGYSKRAKVIGHYISSVGNVFKSKPYYFKIQEDQTDAAES